MLDYEKKISFADIENLTSFDITIMGNQKARLDPNKNYNKRIDIRSALFLRLLIKVDNKYYLLTEHKTINYKKCYGLPNFIFVDKQYIPDTLEYNTELLEKIFKLMFPLQMKMQYLNTGLLIKSSVYPPELFSVNLLNFNTEFAFELEKGVLLTFVLDVEYLQFEELKQYISTNTNYVLHNMQNKPQLDFISTLCVQMQLHKD